MDKLDRISEIKDEAEKIKILNNIWGKGNSSLFTIESALRDLISETMYSNTRISSTIEGQAWRIDLSIKELTGIMKDFIEKATTAAAPQDAQLTTALTPPTESAEAFVGEGGSAVAVSGNEPILVAIGGIENTLAEGLAANTEAIKQASKEEQKLQVANTKALIANETKRQQAEDRNRLLNPNKNKNQLGGGLQKMPKLEMPKFPVNGKQFMSGLGKILKGILNPVALIAGIFMHLLPYIILAVAFFKGFWSKLTPKLKDKVKEIATKIVFYAGLAFLLFKGPALLIKTLQLAWYVIKIGFAVAKWGLEIAFHVLRLLFMGTEHTTKMGFLMFSRLCELIEHIAELASIALEMVLNIAAFVLKVAAIVFIVAAIVLLIGGIILLFVLFGDKIVEAVKKIIEIFAMVGGMIYDAIIGIVNLFCDVIVTLITGILGGLIEAVVKGFRWLFGGGGDEENKSKNEQETTVKDGVTKDLFAATLKPVVYALDGIYDCLATIATAEFLNSLNPMQSMFGSIASSVMTLFNGNSNIIKTENADNTQSSINNKYVSSQKPTDDNKDLKTDVHDIIKLLTKWYEDRDNSSTKAPNGVDG